MDISADSDISASFWNDFTAVRQQNARRKKLDQKPNDAICQTTLPKAVEYCMNTCRDWKKFFLITEINISC